MNNLSDNERHKRRERRTQATLWWLLAASWASTIFYLSTDAFSGEFTVWLLRLILSLLHATVSPRTFDVLHFLLRKCAHMAEYAIFCLLLYRCLVGSGAIAWRGRRALWAILIAGLYSLTDEFHQSFELTRTASLVDCGIDTVGAALGMAFLYVLDRWIQARSSMSEARAESPAEIMKGVAGE